MYNGDNNSRVHLTDRRHGDTRKNLFTQRRLESYVCPGTK